MPGFLNVTSAAVVVTLLAGLLSSACSNPTSPTTLTQEQLAGTWTLVGQQRPGEAEIPPPPGVFFRMELADGRAAITADCNRCSGPGTVGDSSVTIGPTLACTRAFCASAPADDIFLRLLAGESSATLDGDRLTLRSERGVLRFQR